VLHFEAFGPPVFVLRREDGGLDAFRNVCPHRGARLVEGARIGSGVVCPFHAWRFGTDGRLQSRPQEAAFACEGPAPALTRVPVAEKYGLVFLRLDPAGEAIDVDAFLGPMAPLIRSYREAYHHVVVMGDLNVVPAPHLSSSTGLLFNTMRQFTEWSHDMDLHNALLVRCPRASLEEGFFSRSKLPAGTAQLALLDHILVSPGIVRGAAILTLPAGSDRGCPWGDHDPVIADLELGFNPAPSLPKRPPIRWAHFYPPGEWASHEVDPGVNATLDSVLGRLVPAINCPDAVDLNAVFADLLSVAMPNTLRQWHPRTQPMPPSQTTRLAPRPGAC
jgi:nitrite reductase/ring-hydroxylating ferredoxin subunit